MANIADDNVILKILLEAKGGNKVKAALKEIKKEAGGAKDSADDLTKSLSDPNQAKEIIKLQKELKSLRGSIKKTTEEQKQRREETKRLRAEKARTREEEKRLIKLEREAAKAAKLAEKQKRDEVRKTAAAKKLQEREEKASIRAIAVAEKKALQDEKERNRQSIADEKKRIEVNEKGVKGSLNRLQSRIGTAIAAKITADLILQLAQTSRELDQLDQKANIVFGSTLPQITEAAKENANALGLTTNEYIKSAAAIQDLLVPMGFTRQAAADISTQLVDLSGALSEWSGGQSSSAEVADILNKALLGEREQLKSLGISISEADVSTRLLEKGQKGLTGELLQQAKAQATLELITERSTDAQAAFAENAGSATRQTAKLSASIRQIGEDVARTFSGLFERASNLIDGERLVGAVRTTIAQLTGFLSGLGAVGSGAVSVVKTSVLEIEQLYLRAQLLSEQAFGSDAAVEALQGQIKAIQDEQNQLILSGESFGEAYNRAYAEAFKRFEPEVKEAAEESGKAVGKGFGDALTKEQQKALDKYKENVLKASQNLIDLQNALISDDEARAVAEAETAAKRTISSLVGSPGQIKEQTALIKELLQNEITDIRKRFKQGLNESEEFLLSLEIKRSNNKATEEATKTFLDELQKDIDKLSTDPIKLDIQTSTPEQLEADLKAISDSIDAAVPNFGKKLAGLFDPESEGNKKLKEGLGALNEIVGTLFSADDAAAKERIDNIDKLIDKSQERIDKATESGKKGSEEIIKIEEDRIKRLEAAKAAELKKQQQAQRVQASLAAASSLIEAVPLVLKLFSKGGLVGGLTGVAAVLGSIVALRGAIQSNTPTFHTGIESVGEGNHASDNHSLKHDEIYAKLQKRERVLSIDDNKELLRLGVKNKDIAPLVSLGLKKLQPAPKVRTAVLMAGNSSSDQMGQMLKDNAKIIQLQKEQIDKQNINIKYLKNLKTDVSLDEKGFNVKQARLVNNQRKKRKRLG